MKKNLIVLLLCMAMIFVCSCQNGTGSDDIAGGALYKVNLSVELPADGPQRTISVSGGSVSGELTYWYKATPNWTNENVFGKTAGFVEIEDYAAEKDLGYFQQGQWTFDVQVKSGANVVYTGAATTVYINAANTPVEVTVTRGGAGVGTGTIAFDTITAAKINPTLNLNKVLMEYGLVGQDADLETNQTKTCAADSPSLSFEIDDVEGLAAGNYWVKLTYLNNTAEVGSAIVNFTLDAGQTATISGNLVEGEFQTALITINGISSSFTLSEIESSVDAGVVTFTCTATPAGETTYQWYINGDAVGSATTVPSYEWSPTAYQNASITCTATRGNIVVSKSITYQVTELP